jgi:hypothetical protein
MKYLFVLFFVDLPEVPLVAEVTEALEVDALFLNTNICNAECSICMAWIRFSRGNHRSQKEKFSQPARVC